ncbi:lytic murein transglycosylase B [Motiliproteus sediminis]|uniref:lytic murein transglycosylase B n=1 Tax=Motiliproteus sediminis TaxID=1468178 RepID=UPI001FEC0350|nr:lytic murein transglycosylase B [Motiliproteus sediminis]
MRFFYPKPVKRNTLPGMLLGLWLLSPGAVVASYSDSPQARAFVDKMVGEGFDRSYVEQLLSDAQRQDSIIKAISRPAERVKSWGEYRDIFIQPKRIERGVAFWKEHADTLQRASDTYGVPAEIIVAIIGVETHYGRITGNYRVLDALATLAFDYPPRGAFFEGQLRELLYLLREEPLEVASLKGSYAGAMGFGQFIPSSYRNYAVDFDGDGKRDILTNPVDAIGSVANYFKRHGWSAGAPVTVRAEVSAGADPAQFNGSLKPEISVEQWRQRGVRPTVPVAADTQATAMRLEINQGEEYWLGLPNFYVITRYNHSHLYAMAVYQLSQAIRDQWQQS